MFRSAEIRYAAASVGASLAAVVWKPWTHGMTGTGGNDMLSHDAASTSMVSHADLMIPERATTIPRA